MDQMEVSETGQDAVALHTPPGYTAELNFKLRCIGADLGARKKTVPRGYSSGGRS